MSKKQNRHKPRKQKKSFPWILFVLGGAFIVVAALLFARQGLGFDKSSDCDFAGDVMRPCRGREAGDHYKHRREASRFSAGDASQPRGTEQSSDGLPHHKVPSAYGLPGISGNRGKGSFR